MYPLARLTSTILRGLCSHSLPPDGICRTRFWCRPWDVDPLGEMNNGRILTLYDLGRVDLSIRTGLARVLRKNRWGLVVAGTNVQYRRRVRMFESVTMHTQVAAFEPRWVYVLQSMWVQGEPASSAVLRTGVTRRGRAVDTDEVLAAMGIRDWKPEPAGWIQEWISSEQHRPWPPSTDATESSLLQQDL